MPNLIHFFLYEALIQSFRTSTKKLLPLLKRRPKYKDFLVQGPRVTRLKPTLPQRNKSQQQGHTMSGYIFPTQLALLEQEDKMLQEHKGVSTKMLLVLKATEYQMERADEKESCTLGMTLQRLRVLKDQIFHCEHLTPKVPGKCTLKE